jgi:hypothetical protein
MPGTQTVALFMRLARANLWNGRLEEALPGEEAARTKYVEYSRDS